MYGQKVNAGTSPSLFDKYLNFVCIPSKQHITLHHFSLSQLLEIRSSTTKKFNIATNLGSSKDPEQCLYRKRRLIKQTRHNEPVGNRIHNNSILIISLSIDWWRCEINTISELFLFVIHFLISGVLNWLKCLANHQAPSQRGLLLVWSYRFPGEVSPSYLS